MRAQLFKDEAFSRQFLMAILEVYADVVVPWWAVRIMPQVVNTALAKQDLRLITAMSTTLIKKDLQSRLNDYIEWEKKQTATTEKVI